jgi:rhomboid protease GluP
MLGKERFLTAYLVSGITASLLSMYVHPQVTSAGASGAIFGMYGVFLAMLTTNLTEKKMRSAALPSMALYILYQLAMGMKDGIDNAGHIGGLLGGILIGYIMHLSLKNPRSAHIKYNTLAGLAIGVVVLTAWVMSFMK